MEFCWVNSKRWYVLLISLLMVVLVASGAKNLVQTADYKVYFDKNDEQLLASNKLGDDYSQSDNVLFVIAPKDGNVFTQKTLTAIKELTEASWKVPLSTRVDSITNYQYSYAQGDELIIEDLVSSPSTLNTQQLANIQRIALTEPVLAKRLISGDAKVTGVNVTINFTDGMVDSETREVVAYARELAVKTLEKHPELDIHLTGIVMLNNAFPETSEKDGAQLVPAMLLIILVGLFLLFRSGSAVFATLLVMLLSIASAMGVAGWLGYKINPVSGAAPIIIITVVVADCVHILMSFFSQYRGTTIERSAAIQKALQLNVKPVVLTTVSTAIGFLSMNFSDAPPFRELGNIAAAGILTACFLALTLFPALLNILPIKQNQKIKSQNPVLSKSLLGLSKKVWAAPGKILLVCLVGAIGLSSLAFKNELNEDFVRYFDESFDIRTSTEFTLNNLTGISVVEYDFPAKGAEQIAEPEYFNGLESFAVWLRKQPEVVHVNSFSDTIKRLNKNLNNDDPAYYLIPDSRELIAQYIVLYETSLPFGLGITDRVKLDKSATRLTVTLNDVTNNQLLALENRAQTWINKNLPAYMHSEGLGWSMMFGTVAKKNIISMIDATLIAVFLISVMLILPFKSLRIGAISLIPNILPAMVALGIWGLTVGMIGLAASIILALTFGIVVDDSIHFISRYVRNRRTLGMPLKEAMEDTFLTVGKAIVVTSIILIFGFAVLATSGFKINSIIGYLSAMTILSALVLDLLLLPALLIKLDGWLFKKNISETPEDNELSNLARSS